MKKIKIFLIFSMLSSILFSQDLNSVLENIKNGELKEAQISIEKIVAEKPGIESAKAWLFKGAVYQSIFESEVTIPNINDDPLNIAYKSYMHSIELDSSKEYMQAALNSLGILANLFVRKGIDEFNTGEYSKSLQSFENTISINNMPAIMYLDTMIIYNAAIAAEKANEIDKSKQYYKELIILGFEKPRMYNELALLLKKEGDIENYIKILKEGVDICSKDNNALIIELVNYYLSVNDNENTVKYLESAMLQEPDNANNYYVRGSLFNQIKEADKAEKFYNKALKYNPNHTDALYNLGAMYYNQGIDIRNDAKTKTERAVADEKFEKALPYFEKVHKLQQTDIPTMKLLISLYKITKQEDKQKEIELKLEKQE